jgi:hypothetical protein
VLALCVVNAVIFIIWVIGTFGTGFVMWLIGTKLIGNDNCIWKRFVHRDGATCNACYGVHSDIDCNRLGLDAVDNHGNYNIAHYAAGGSVGFSVICLCDH